MARSSFDESKQETIYEKDLGEIVIGVYSYDGGELKVGMVRKLKDGKFRAMGRTTMEEWEKIVEVGPEIVKVLKKANGKKTKKKKKEK